MFCLLLLSVSAMAFYKCRCINAL